jgi:uncharacterized protein YdeI (YjbR/CyaY-like superfamily)
MPNKKTAAKKAAKAKRGLDPRIDAYMAKSAPFAQPILRHLRSIVHAACPNVVETIKWGMPHFDYLGIMCAMAAFKAHCTFGFWKGALIIGKQHQNAMGQFGRITDIKDLPSKQQIGAYVKAAMKLNEAGAKAPHMRNRQVRKPLPVPKDLAAALKGNKRARTVFSGFSPSNRRDYIEWITEAKTDETRERRLATTLEWLEEGKPRNWKYMKK